MWSSNGRQNTAPACSKVESVRLVAIFTAYGNVETEAFTRAHGLFALRRVVIYSVSDSSQAAAERNRIAIPYREATVKEAQAAASLDIAHVVESVMRPSAASWVQRDVRAALPPFAPVTVGFATAAEPKKPRLFPVD